jgi:predicted GNAT family acetyltransferase
MSTMELRTHRFQAVDAFLGAAGEFLAEREAEHNLIFGICSWVRASPDLIVDQPPIFLTVTDAAGRVVAASLRTPPNNQVLSEMSDRSAADALADALRDEAIPGVLGPKEPAARFVERWRGTTGQPSRLVVAERIFRLDRVIPPRRPAPGTWRLAEPRDRQLVAEWLVAFVSEALPDDPPPPDPLGMADRWIGVGFRTLYLWEDDGRVVSLVGAGGETPNGIRIGPVYTPHELRGRGYATALTAAVSQDQLDRGRRFCFLFTDLANPTSNHIYQEIGYQPVGDVDQYRFDPVS